MADENLTAALSGSLRLVEENPDSPLSEAKPDSVDILLDRINEHLVAGMPHKITDEELRRVIEVYRAQALNWAQQEQVKKPRAKGPKKSPAEAIDIDL